MEVWLICLLVLLWAFREFWSAKKSLEQPVKERSVSQQLAPLIGARTEVFNREHRLFCDLLTRETAIEVDFARKYAEAIGQSVLYGLVFKRSPGIILIVEGLKDVRYVEHCRTVCEHLKIRLWKCRLTGQGPTLEVVYSPSR